MKKINRIFCLIIIFFTADICFTQISLDNNTSSYNYTSENRSISCPVTWVTTVYASDVSKKTDSVKIGMSSMGTYGIDTCLGEYLIPPPPPAGIFDFRIIFIPTHTLDASKTDFRNDTIASATYWLNFQPSVPGSMIFTWDSTDFPDSGRFHLIEEINGTNIDMRSQSSFEVSNSGIRYLKIQYELYSSYVISVDNGWNLTSIPLLASDMSVSALFDSDAVSAFSYNTGYNSVTNLTNGKGFWIKFPSAKNYNIIGDLISSKNINVVSGWNIIGPFDEKIPVNDIVTDPPGLLASNFFAFQNGYFNEDTLIPGKGYWVKTNSTGILMKDTNDSFRPYAVYNNNENLKDWLRFKITDNSGNVSELYLTDTEKSISYYKLPPVPPAGIFDVRFNSDKYVEKFGNDHIVKLNSFERPLKIKAFNLNGKNIRLKDNIDGTILNIILKENETVTINNELDNFSIISESVLPESYSLSQNFPNPFNPSTSIVYQIPKDGNVRLSVFNVLGQEISLLVNELQQTGSYKINFNATELSSGIYYYKIKSGSFTQIKSMILIK